MRVHTDEEILRKVLTVDRNQEEIKNGKVDIAVDLDDEHGTCHTYVVTFVQNGKEWDCSQIEEISSL